MRTKEWGALLLLSYAASASAEEPQALMFIPVAASVVEETVTLNTTTESMVDIDVTSLSNLKPMDIELILGAGLSTTQILSGSIGVVIGESGMGQALGLIVQLEPGITGGKIALGGGYSSFGEEVEIGNTDIYFYIPIQAWEAKAVLFQPWGTEELQTAMGFNPGQTYLGLEAGFVQLIRVNAGVMWQITGSELGSFVVNGSIGFGF